jgi:hypothetical protein
MPTDPGWPDQNRQSEYHWKLQCACVVNVVHVCMYVSLCHVLAVKTTAAWLPEGCYVEQQRPAAVVFSSLCQQSVSNTMLCAVQHFLHTVIRQQRIWLVENCAVGVVCSG